MLNNPPRNEFAERERVICLESEPAAEPVVQQEDFLMTRVVGAHGSIERRWRVDNILRVERCVHVECPWTVELGCIQTTMELPATLPWAFINASISFDLDDDADAITHDMYAELYYKGVYIRTYEREHPRTDIAQLAGWRAGYSYVTVLDQGPDEDLYRHLRRTGATKQVAAECVAADYRARKIAAMRIANDGYESYKAITEVRLPCGEVISDEESPFYCIYAQSGPERVRDAARYIFTRVLTAVEELGYLVPDAPEKYRDTKEQRRQERRITYRHYMNQQNWRLDHYDHL